ncbi:hypothetical protein Lal_00041666 [Lupinus albus]|nr:hypothetical protein Lal_00041666 [Lupinus albus]
MELILGFLIFGISITFYAFVVQSQILDVNGAESSPAFGSPPPPPPPPLSPPPPSPSIGSPPPSRSPPRRNHAPSNEELNNEATMRKSPPHHNHHHHLIHFPPPWPPPPRRGMMNAGKKVGFLVFKRKQLLKTNETYSRDSRLGEKSSLGRVKSRAILEDSRLSESWLA